MYRGLEVAVVIPAHNEAVLLPRTLRGLPPFVDHILVVDDASTDQTADVAFLKERRVELLRHIENRGVGAAIVTGYRRALELDADAVVVVGADAQMAPDEMSRLLDELAEGRADYAKGDRLGHPELCQKMPAVRRFGNQALTWLTRRAVGLRQMRDSQCGYTALSRNALARLPLDQLYPRYGFPNDLLARLVEVDARIVDCPVTPIYGEERSGIRVWKVVLPISWLLLRAFLRRVRRRTSTANLSVAARTEP